MKLQIELKKELEKPSVLTCIREDKTSTYASLYPNLEIHDIAHFVVETHLNYTNAFFGLLAKGYDISDFQLPKDKRPLALQTGKLSAEALVTEHIVNILQTWYAQKNTNTNLLKVLVIILDENKLPFPPGLTSEKFQAMYQHLDGLMGQWNALPIGQKLSLPFKV